MEPETIKVKILYFGAAAEITRTREEEVTFPLGTSAGNAFRNILLNYPQLRERFDRSLLFAVNQEYATGEEIFNYADELAVITTVSGG